MATSPPHNRFSVCFLPVPLPPAYYMSLEYCSFFLSTSMIFFNLLVCKSAILFFFLSPRNVFLMSPSILQFHSGLCPKLGLSYFMDLCIQSHRLLKGWEKTLIRKTEQKKRGKVRWKVKVAYTEWHEKRGGTPLQCNHVATPLWSCQVLFNTSCIHSKHYSKY